MKTRDPDPFADPAARAESSDDPFARAADAGEPSGATEVERSVTVVGPLAQRDPDAPVEDSTEFQVRGEASFDDLLRHVRWRGFRAGVVVGGLLAALGAVAFSWTTSRSGAPRMAEPRRVAGEAPGIAPVPLEAPGGRPPEPGPAPAAPEASRPARAPGKRRVRSGAVEDRRGVAAPDLVLRSAVEPSGSGTGPPAPPAAERAPPRRLEPATVASAFSARREEIEGCASAHPGDVAGAGGRRFHLVLTIDGAGQVAAQIDDAEIDATALGTCLVRLARDLRFAPFDGEPVRVDLPLRFAGGE